jgi:hypothetical protein
MAIATSTPQQWTMDENGLFHTSPPQARKLRRDMDGIQDCYKSTLQTAIQWNTLLP